MRPLRTLGWIMPRWLLLWPALNLLLGMAVCIDARGETRPGGPGQMVAVSWNAEGQPLRHPADIAAIFERVEVSPGVRSRALAALNALTEAEAHAHQIAPAEVHFHEVGAIDTLVDILGAAYAVEALGVSRICASPLPWFSGTVECAHGRIPLPAPATAYLMRGKPVFATDAREELVTPTGAALVHVLTDQFVSGPEGVAVALGTGYGSRPAPAGLRAWLVEDGAGGADHVLGGREKVMQFESHIDHLNGEDLGMALEALSAIAETLEHCRARLPESDELDELLEKVRTRQAALRERTAKSLRQSLRILRGNPSARTKGGLQEVLDALRRMDEK